MGVHIDRDELLELYANTDDFDISNYDVKVAVIRQNILDMPTIDIVRCGECRYFDYDDGVCRRPKKLSFIAEPTDFCSYGERRADE